VRSADTLLVIRVCREGLSDVPLKTALAVVTETPLSPSMTDINPALAQRLDTEPGFLAMRLLAR